MRYEILGPLRVIDAHGVATLNTPKVGSLLATLLVRADRFVEADQLIAALWADRPPRRAMAGLHVYVSALRKFLSRPDRPDGRIRTAPAGYMLELGDDEFDVHDFRRLVEQGRAHGRAQRFAAALACFEEALALWRGPALGEVGGGPATDMFVTWLDEVRMECVELLVDVQLRLGLHRQLVGRLFLLTAEHPLRETLYRQLMLALYRSERPAEALRVYQSVRRTLRGELGLEPGRALRETQRAILAADEPFLLSDRVHSVL
jgi:DNA-binding SARP family transcriptional activator